MRKDLNFGQYEVGQGDVGNLPINREQSRTGGKRPMRSETVIVSL